jgi:hypothetical protein
VGDALVSRSWNFTTDGWHQEVDLPIGDIPKYQNGYLEWKQQSGTIHVRNIRLDYPNGEYTTNTSGAEVFRSDIDYNKLYGQNEFKVTLTNLN